MRKLSFVAGALLALTAPAWSVTVSYDGSSSPPSQSWPLYGGAVEQGYRVSEPGGNYAWWISDAAGPSGGKVLTKYNWGGAPPINMIPAVGGTLSARVKCFDWSIGNGGRDPLNLAIYQQSPAKANYVSVKPDMLQMREIAGPPSHSSSQPETYPGDFNSYHVIRLCYKSQNLRVRGMQLQTWATYVGHGTLPADPLGEVPVLVSWTDAAPHESFGGPAWGAGSNGNSQEIAFDWVNFTDNGAFPPGMDGTVTFTDGDPDGTAAVNGASFTINWTTNVNANGEVHYSANGENTYSNVVVESGGLKTSHSVTVNSTVPGTTYDYYVVSTDALGKKAISLPCYISCPNPFYISSGPATAPAPDGRSCTATWTTSSPDESSEVHYGLDPSCPYIAIEPGGGGKTIHSVTFSTNPCYFYYHYVKSIHSLYLPAQSAVLNFNTYTGCTNLKNPGFEDQAQSPLWNPPGWGKWDSYDDRCWPDQEWAVPCHSGYRYYGYVSQGSPVKMMAGIYQSVPATAGKWYQAKVWIWTRRMGWPSHAFDAECRIGIDPAGGTDPGHWQDGIANGTWVENPTLTWSGWAETANSNSDTSGVGGPWEQIDVLAKATGSQVTVFLMGDQKWGQGWNYELFDDASIQEVTLPPNIGGYKDKPDGYPVVLSAKRVTHHLLGQTDAGVFDYCVIEEDDRSAGIRVQLPLASEGWDPGTAVRGSRIDLEGRLSRLGPELQVIAASTTVTSTGQGDPDPLGTKNAWGHGGIPPVPPPIQTDVGLPMTGLLVRTAGKCTYSDTFTQNPPWYLLSFWIDDGCGVLGGLTWEGLPAYGIKVYHDGSVMPNPGSDLVIATGIAGVEVFDPTPESPNDGDEYLVRVLFLRDYTDAYMIPPP